MVIYTVVLKANTIMQIFVYIGAVLSAFAGEKIFISNRTSSTEHVSNLSEFNRVQKLLAQKNHVRGVGVCPRASRMHNWFITYVVMEP